MKLSVKSVSQLVGSKWLVLATFFCQSLVLCIYIGLSDETTWKRVKLCILQLKSPFTSWKGNPRRILTLGEAGFVRDFSRGKLELSGQLLVWGITVVVSLCRAMRFNPVLWHLAAASTSVCCYPGKRKDIFRTKVVCVKHLGRMYECVFFWNGSLFLLPFCCCCCFYVELEIIQFIWLLKSLSY